MGGGDLNLKKSWHPSTLKNIERVWKAEQKHDAEQKKIEQLQKELEDERNRMEMRIYAEDKGVVKKKSERLDWMYQGPASLVNREDYLTGRPVDKSFDVLQQMEGSAPQKSEDNNVPTSFFGSASLDSVTVDLANKIREDPLFMIRKQEEESKKQLLNNPVRMKQLQQLLKKQMEKETKKKKKNKKKRKAEKVKKEKQHSRKHHRRHRSSGSSSESSVSDEPQTAKQFKSAELRSSHVDKPRRNRHDSSSGDDDWRSKHRKRYGLIENSEPLKRREDKPKVRSRSKSKSPARISGKFRPRSPECKTDFKRRQKLDPKELEKRRQEMQENAKWRDEQRSKNVSKFRKIEAKEIESLESNRESSSEFIRPLLSSAATNGSLEGRIKSNIYNIQRTRADLEKNFARR